MSAPYIEIYKYTLPLVRTLRLKDQVLNERTGLILKFCGRKGNIGYGDIAPLPGYSLETLDEAQEAVVTWARYALARVPQTSFERDKMLHVLAMTPSVMFCTECATLSLAYDAGAILPEGLFSNIRRNVSVNALITGTMDEALESAEILTDKQYRSIKLKVGRQSLDNDIEMVRQVRRILGDDVALRLDANRAWDFDTALRFARGVADCAIEFIEEPLTVPSRLQQFSKRSGLPIALDESAREDIDGPDFFSENQWAKAIILKPTLLGGIRMTMDWAAQALQYGLKPIISSCFESGIGLIALAHLAASITEDDVPVGLDTYSWLGSDILGTRFAVRNGSLDLNELDTCATTINTDMMELVERV